VSEPLGVDRLATRLESIATGLTTLSRLHALKLLGAADSLGKLNEARAASVSIDGAAQVEEFLGRYFQRQLRKIAWPDAWHPNQRGFVADCKVTTRRLTIAAATLANEVANEVAGLRAVVSEDLCGSAVEPLLAQLATILPPASSTVRRDTRTLTGADEGPPRRSAIGPTHVKTDPVFRPSFSLMDRAIPHWTLASNVAVPHFWTVCIKETLGAELCALSMVEYDGLPLAFYRDMAKQAWDEMRHALLYLRAAIKLIPELRASLVTDEPLAIELANFERTGRGLPIPIERNLYEAIWNSTLAERLVLFQVDTEVPGSARKKKKQATRELDDHPDLARAIEYDLMDEQDHKRVGRTWLKYLIPDPADRRESIGATRLIRGILMLTAFAHHGRRDLGDLIADFSERGFIPSSTATAHA